MSSSTPTPTTSTKEVAKDGVNSVNGREASSEEVVVKKDASKLAVIAPRRLPSEEGHSPRLVIASPSATPSPKPVAASNSLRPSPVAPSPRVSPKPVAATASLRPSPAAASPRVSPKPETASLALKTLSASPRPSPKPSTTPAPTSISTKEPTPSSSAVIAPTDSSDSSTSPKVTAPKTLPILSLPASTSPPSPSKSPGIASAPTPSNTGSSSLPEPTKQPTETSASVPATPKLTALLSATPTATVAPTTSSSSAPGPVKLAKLAVNGRKTKEKKAPVTATMATLPPGVQLKPALPFSPGMMGGPMFYRAPGSNQLVQLIQQPTPAMLQQLQRLRGEAPTTSNGQTATVAVAPVPARPAGPVPIAPRPANMPSTSTAPSNTTNAKIAPKKPSGPLNIRPRPIEKRPIAVSQPGPSTSTVMSNPPIVSFQRAPNNIMYYSQGVRFAAPMQGTPVSGAPTMMNQAFRMVGHPGAAGIFPAQMAPGAMMSPGGYMPFPYMSYMGGAPQFVHMPTMIPASSMQSVVPQGGVPATVSTSAPTLTEQGPSVAQTAAVNPDEDENDPPPPLLEPDQASMESPPPPRRADAIAAAEAAIATTSAPPAQSTPSEFATIRAKEVNDVFWKQATVFRKLRRSRQVKLNGPMKHVLKNNVIEEKPNPFTPIKTPADRLAELRDQKKATKRTPQRPPSPEATEDDEPEQAEPSPPARRGRKKKLSLPVKAAVKVEPKKLRTTTPKKLQNGTRSAPSTTSRRSARSVSSQRSSRYSESTSKNTPTSSKSKSRRRARKGRAGEIEKLIAMDFGSGKSPFQTTDVSEYVKKVKKESTLLRPAVVHSYTEHDDYDEDDEEEEEDDYDSMMTEETPECEEEESTASPTRSEDEDDDEEEVCLGCSTPFSGGLRSERYPQYCTKACRAEFRDARRQSRKRQSGALAATATASSSVSREGGGLDELPEQPTDAEEVESKEPEAKVRRLSEDEPEPKAPTPSLPTMPEPTADNSPPPPPRAINPPEVTPTPPSTEPTDPVATTPTSSGAPPTSNTSPVNEHQKALDTACLSAANVHDWTADDVAIWVNVVTNSSTNGDAFRAEEIDGSSLLMLNSEHLKDALKFKLGPALKLGKAIDWLRNTSET
uniref:SAM domain-containing protein n=1 Tax=Panagrellus redivivus TaxID=6233 RepID=A0A7E4UYY5_PANRE